MLHSYCHSEKGWTENKIAVDYLHWFNKHTKSKLEAGEKCLLPLDGHVSHFSKTFIQWAIELNIVVLCYPPHSTHVLQGLDMVLFSHAKVEWTKSHDWWECDTGEMVTKETFLNVFGESYLAAFTPANNKKPFSKTGVHPFGHSVIKSKDCHDLFPREEMALQASRLGLSHWAGPSVTGSTSESQGSNRGIIVVILAKGSSLSMGIYIHD